MTSTLNRWIPVLLVGALLAGCNGLLVPHGASMRGPELFAKGLDQYTESGDLQSLKVLSQQPEEGQWAARAELVVQLVEQQEKLLAEIESKADVKAAGQTKQALLEEKKLERCNNEMLVLRQNNQALEETIAQLKKLLIEMESRSN